MKSTVSLRRKRYLIDLTSLFNVFNFSNQSYFIDFNKDSNINKDWEKVGGDISWSMKRLEKMELKIKTMR